MISKNTDILNKKNSFINQVSGSGFFPPTILYEYWQSKG